MRLAAVMERVRTILGHLKFRSVQGYRAARRSTRRSAVTTKSQHIHGLACDFTCPGFGIPLEICLKLEPHMIELQIDQLIHEFKTIEVHLGLVSNGFDARHMTIDGRSDPAHGVGF